MYGGNQLWLQLRTVMLLYCIYCTYMYNTVHVLGRYCTVLASNHPCCHTYLSGKNYDADILKRGGYELVPVWGNGHRVPFYPFKNSHHCAVRQGIMSRSSSPRDDGLAGGVQCESFTGAGSADRLERVFPRDGLSEGAFSALDSTSSQSSMAWYALTFFQPFL